MLSSQKIIVIAIIEMFIFESISLLVPDYEAMGLVSFTHYFSPYDILKFGKVNVSGVFVLITVMTTCLVIAMIYFEHHDIAVT